MQCYTELAPPTAVSHAVTLPFASSRATNLVVAKNSLLQVFELRSTITEVKPEWLYDFAPAYFDPNNMDGEVKRIMATLKARKDKPAAPSKRR